MIRLVALAVGAVIAVTGLRAQSALSDWTVGLRRIGTFEFGASISDMRQRLGDPAAALIQALNQDHQLPREPDDAGCAYLMTTRVPRGIGLMFQHGRFVRADVWQPGIRTANGLQVGDTELRVLEIHGSRVEVTPHHYGPPGAHYLILRPTDAIDRDFQILFETDGREVTQFRAGFRTAVAQVEGCA